MHEREPAFVEAQTILDRNYITSWNVRARFWLNEFAEPYVDMDSTAIEALNLKSRERIVDLGAADGRLLQQLEFQGHDSNLLIGVEPNHSQYENYANEIVDPMDILAAISKYTREGKIALPQDVIEEFVNEFSKPRSMNFKMLEGTANKIPLENASAEVIFAMYMLYHIPISERPAAFEEIKRVIEPGGRLVVATSGAFNKMFHRLRENEIADALQNNTTPPRMMNFGFTTERAIEELPQQFKYVYIFKQDANMMINDPLSRTAYLNSHRSLRDQYTPVPVIENFEKALKDKVVPHFYRPKHSPNRPVDVIQRSLFICSDSEYPCPPGFVRLLQKSA